MSSDDAITAHLREADEALCRARDAVKVAQTLLTCPRTKARMDSVSIRIESGLNTVERLIVERTTNTEGV